MGGVPRPIDCGPGSTRIATDGSNLTGSGEGPPPAGRPIWAGPGRCRSRLLPAIGRANAAWSGPTGSGGPDREQELPPTRGPVRSDPLWEPAPAGDRSGRFRPDREQELPPTRGPGRAGSGRCRSRLLPAIGRAGADLIGPTGSGADLPRSVAIIGRRLSPCRARSPRPPGRWPPSSRRPPGGSGRTVLVTAFAVSPGLLSSIAWRIAGRGQAA